MSATSDPTVAAAPGVFDRERRALTLGLVLTVTMVGFESLAVSTALPEIQADLHGLALYGWVSAAYLLGHLVGIPAAGLLSDRRGLALPYTVGLLLFGVGLAVAGAAPSMGVVVAARLVQGVGGGAIPAVAYVAAGRGYPPELRARVFAITSTAWVLPGLLGPSISAGVTSLFGWRWVFFGLLPLVPLAAAMTLPSLRRMGEGATPASPGSGRSDPPAGAEPSPSPGAVGAGASAAAAGARRLRLAVTLAVGVAALLTAADLALPLAPALGAAGLAVAVRSYLALAPAGTLRLAPGLPATIGLRAFQTFAFFGIDFFVPYAFHDVHGTSLGVAGLAATAATFSWTAGAWVAERVLPRVGPRAQLRRSLSILLLGSVVGVLVLWPGPLQLLAGLLGATLLGLGMGLGYSVVSVTMLAYAEPGREGLTASSLSLTDTLGAALATGLGGACIALGADRGWEPRDGVLLAYALPILAGAAGVLAASRLPARLPEARGAASGSAAPAGERS